MARTEIKVVLKAESALSLLRSRTGNQFAQTLDYLPGSAVRGAFAEIFLNKRGVDDADFQRIFVDEAVWFNDFLPSYSDNAMLLAPATMSVCKRFGTEHPESVRDRLLEAITGRSLPEEKKCPRCTDEPLKRLDGKYFEAEDSRSFPKLPKQLRMHVGISRATGSALHSLLFSYETLMTEKPKGKEHKPGNEDEAPAQPLKFVGTLSANDKSALDALAQVVTDREHLSVGHARTRGLGELSIETRTPLEPKGDLATRCEAFNKAVQAKGGDAGMFYFAITLNSHLALRDRLGRPVLENLHADHFGLHADQLKLAVSFLSAAVVPGWNAALGLPKADTHAISRGSVVVFSLPKAAVTEQLMNRLVELESEGVGERRAEGFGSLTVCHPIHYKLAAE